MSQPAHTVPPTAPADPLGEALHVLRMSSSFYSAGAFAAPWALELPPFAGALVVHIVTAGDPWLVAAGVAPRQLHPGDLALVPHGEGHILASQPSRVGAPGTDGPEPVNLRALPRQQLSERYERIRIAGSGAPTTMLCGTITFDHPAADRLIRMLPRLIVVPAESAQHADWIAHTVRFLAGEARDLRPGGETIVTRLADVLVIHAIRSWIAEEGAGEDDREGAAGGWLRALRDPQLGPALVLIHREPAEAWTVARLAHAVAMSRSGFAARFTALVGDTPMQYVTRWRMQIAATTLRAGKASVGEVALGLGYASEAAFSRAFKRTMGISPAAVRRLARDAAAEHIPDEKTAPGHQTGGRLLA